jgi:hypothetical protein
MAGLDLRQAGASHAEVAGEAQLQKRGQCHQDGDLHREDLQEDEQLTADGHPARGAKVLKGTQLM